MTDLKGYALDITPNNDLYMIASIKDDEILMYEALKKDIKSKKSIEKTNLKMNTKNDIPSFFALYVILQYDLCLYWKMKCDTI